jgi:hypothetical protein
MSLRKQLAYRNYSVIIALRYAQPCVDVGLTAIFFCDLNQSPDVEPAILYFNGTLTRTYQLALVSE